MQNLSLTDVSLLSCYLDLYNAIILEVEPLININSLNQQYLPIDSVKKFDQGDCSYKLFRSCFIEKSKFQSLEKA